MRKDSNISFDNCLFEGRVFHKRSAPRNHSFKYNVFCICFDLCKKKNVFKDIPIFLLINLIYFLFMMQIMDPKNCKNLEKWIKQTIKKLGKKQIVNSIFVLAYPRILGYVFNPLSIFTCLDKDGKIIAQIYEVHNTFKQRHFYITEDTFKPRKPMKKI